MDKNKEVGPHKSLFEIANQSANIQVLREMSEQGVPFTNDVVYYIYKGDDPNTLPIEILEQMERHLSSIVMKKRSLKIQEIRATCTHTHPDGKTAFVFEGMQHNGYEQCTLCNKIKGTR